LILVNLSTFSASSHSCWFDEECAEATKNNNNNNKNKIRLVVK
jgi:hypothetical protein